MDESLIEFLLEKLPLDLRRRYNEKRQKQNMDLPIFLKELLCDLHVVTDCLTV